MEKKKDIEPCNSKDEWHGYQEWYYVDNSIKIRVMFKNDQEIGYEEYHSTHGRKSITNFYIK
jgi:hypothetical protein